MKIPKIKTTLAFLRSNGWFLKKTTKTKKYYVLKAPPQIEFEKPFTVRIPKYKGAIEFKEYMVQLGFSIAAMYDWDKFELLELLSKSLSELESDISQERKSIQLKETMLSFGVT